MKNYLELKIPVQRNAQWYRELCDAMQGERIPVRWQNGFYHITVAFLHDDNHVKELGDAFSQILSKRQRNSKNEGMSYLPLCQRKASSLSLLQTIQQNTMSTIINLFTTI